VKLWQFDPADRTQVRIDTGTMRYQPTIDRRGVEIIPLFCDGREDVRLERWASGAAITLAVPGGAEVLVLDGNFDENGERLEPQSWLQLPAGGTLEAQSGLGGCKVWIKTGHLLRIEGA